MRLETTNRVSRAFTRQLALCLASLLILTVLLPASFGAQMTDYQVKAAFLYNFAKFVEWPAIAHTSTNSPLVIGFVGEDSISESLSALTKGQTAQGRPIEVRSCEFDSNLSGCHVLFLGHKAAGKTKDILARIGSAHVLTVGDGEEFIQQGGIIGFAIVDKSVKFDINAKAAETAQLKVSSRLMAVARTVVKTK
jgi:hypothetical protein